MAETETDLDAYAEAAAAMLGLAVEPEWRETIVVNLRVLRAAADLVGAFPLPDEAEAAPVFTA
ncbi:DUF4089 domain-containing protein [Methylobacterium oxalidis]|uniref:DUF4089 domain-containing protein n=1 Tax=Methylobacterium oxalidis TaxID=944322 RepID=A0A512J7J4_9HYPH|nr:DUF4089 domain-containing protein [Methylobacterium oxalidis]GEP05903.1 hypothetical protein MOX02_39410 [Methylobacterium oxalidis]GJE32512.1 hypothetical protein LDDCCGHA_2698 [Methylobacterium oxalidis]GLS61670.1 hypothetical protein GCM10007888_00510 [Methylobacterium oxalidis]